MNSVRHYVIFSLFFILTACGQKQESVWINGWQETSALPVARAGAATLVVNDVMYVIGGVDGRNILNDAVYAKINTDGSLGVWQQGPQLLEERVFISAAHFNGAIYVVGGGNGSNGEHLLNTVERAIIQVDGSLGPWQSQPNMNLPRRCSKVVVLNDTLFTLGGFGGALLDTVEHAVFNEDGSMGKWQMESGKLTIPRYVTGLKKWKDAAYVIGGHDQTKGVGIADVEWARVSESGDFTSWQATTSLQTGRYGLATAAHNDRLYALGGITGAEYIDSIEMSLVAKDGSLGAWQETTMLTQPRASFNSVTYKDWIYVVGGTNREGYLTSVEFARFADDGSPGFWGTTRQAEIYKAQREERKNRKLNLPNSGIVKEVINASAYTYMQVLSQRDGLVWIAGPKTEIKPEASISYSKGVYMSNFFSKELQRTFPAVLFVGTIQIE